MIVVVSAPIKILKTLFYSWKGGRSCDPLTFFWSIFFTLAFATYIAGCRAHDFRCREHEFALRCESMYMGRLKVMLCLILVRLRSAAQAAVRTTSGAGNMSLRYGVSPCTWVGLR